MKPFQALLPLAVVVVLSGCSTLGPNQADPHWTRVGTHVEFRNVSAEDQERDYWAWDGKPSGQAFRYLSFRATKKSGSTTYGYGIMWAYRDDRNFARLLITADQGIAVHEYRDGTLFSVVEWQRITPLNVGLNVANEIRLEQLPEGIHLMVNGQDAGVIPSSYPLEGKMGCYCAVGPGEVKPGDVSVEFDFEAYEIEIPDLKVGSHFQASLEGAHTPS